MKPKGETTIVRHAKIYRRYIEVLTSKEIMPVMEIYSRTADGYYSTYHIINVIRKIRKDPEYKKKVNSIVQQLRFDEL